MAIKDYSTTPDMNTTISGINIAEGCAPSGINNAIRQLMADVKEEQNARDARDSGQDAATAAAQKSADAAQTAADTAQSTADAAQTAADAAQSTADAAQTAADAAQTTADAAQSTADAAQTTADAAQSTADAAQSTADAAQSTADAAQSTADAAQTTANGKAPKAHASAYNTYGVATGGMYGHTRLSDYANADRDVSAGFAATPKAVQTSCASVKVPTGFVIAFAGNPDSAPSGYLSCKGSAVSRTTYANLFAVIGETYGAGNGSTTFNLPDLTGRFIQGYDNDFPVGSVKEAGLPNATGTFHALSGNASGAFSEGTTWVSDDPGDGDTCKVNVAVTMNLNASNSIYGASTTVQPPAVTMRYYIKY